MNLTIVCGVELAAEVATEYPHICTTIVSSGPTVLSSTNYTSCLKNSITNQLKRLNVEIVFNERIETEISSYSLTSQTLHSQFGKEFDADIVFMTVGNASFNSYFLSSLVESEGLDRNQVLTTKGQIKVYKTGAVKGT